MSTETAQAAETTAFNSATDNPSDPAGTFLPPTASHAAKSLSLFISGKPLLSDKTLAIYTRVIREGMDNQSYTMADWNEALGLDADNPLGDVVLRTLESRVSDNDAVLESSKTLETQLKEKFGAEGRGLHEYTSNVEDELPDNLVKTLRWIATRRNGIVHDDGDGFQDTQERARYVLQAARSWDWLRNANYESPETDEQRVAASSYGRSGMNWLERLSKINKEPSPKEMVIIFGSIGIVAIIMAWVLVGFIAAIIALIITLYLTGKTSWMAYQQQQNQKKKNERKNKVRKLTL